MTEGSACSNGFAPRTAAAQARVDDAAQQTSAGRLQRGFDSANQPQQHGAARIIAGPGGPIAAGIIHTRRHTVTRRRRAVAPALPERFRVAGDGSAVTLGTSLRRRPRHPQRSASDPHVRARATRPPHKAFFAASASPQHTRRSRL
jgi:hypothetical protein